MPLDLHIEYVLLLCLPFLVHNHYFTLPVHHLPQSSSSCLGLLAGQRKRIKAFFPRFPPRKKRPCCCHLTTSTSVGNRYLYRSELLPERPRSGPSTRLAAVLGLVNGRSAERRRETPSSYGGAKIGIEARERHRRDPNIVAFEFDRVRPSSCFVKT